MVQSGHGSLPTAAFIRRIGTSVAGVLGLEPRLTEPESAGLPITPYPIAHAAATMRARRRGTGNDFTVERLGAQTTLAGRRRPDDRQIDRRAQLHPARHQAGEHGEHGEATHIE